MKQLHIIKKIGRHDVTYQAYEGSSLILQMIFTKKDNTYYKETLISKGDTKGIYAQIVYKKISFKEFRKIAINIK